MDRRTRIDNEAPYTAGGMPVQVGIGLLTGLLLLFVLMLGGPAGGLPVAATFAYLTLYTLGYFILRSSRPRAAGFARERSYRVRVGAARLAASAARTLVSAGRAAAAEGPRMIAEIRGHRDVADVGPLRQPARL